MAFIQPCFIRKNTPELRKKLEGLGYKMNLIYSPNEQNLYIGGGVYSSANFIDNYYLDCGTNEELFIALAALRDDTPINSYYWFNNKLVICYSVFDLNVNQGVTYRFMDMGNPKICFPSNIDCMRKATVEEIIEHFKK